MKLDNMNSLKEYIIEKFKITKDIKSDDTYYIFYCKDINKLKNLNNLEEIKPIYTLKKDDIKETSNTIELNINDKIVDIEDIKTDNNYDPGFRNGDMPEEGDLIFYFENEYYIYRPTIIQASGSNEDTDKEDCIFIGKKEAIIYSIFLFCDFYKIKTNIEELKNYKG